MMIRFTALALFVFAQTSILLGCASSTVTPTETVMPTGLKRQSDSAGGVCLAEFARCVPNDDQCCAGMSCLGGVNAQCVKN
jgi:hypothetical protein